MARTKQTARKSHGGKAPRKSRANKKQVDLNDPDIVYSKEVSKIENMKVDELLAQLKTYKKFENKSIRYIREYIGNKVKSDKPATKVQLREYLIDLTYKKYKEDKLVYQTLSSIFDVLSINIDKKDQIVNKPPRHRGQLNTNQQKWEYMSSEILYNSVMAYLNI